MATTVLTTYEGFWKTRNTGKEVDYDVWGSPAALSSMYIPMSNLILSCTER